MINRRRLEIVEASAMAGFVPPSDAVQQGTGILTCDWCQRVTTRLYVCDECGDSGYLCDGCMGKHQAADAANRHPDARPQTAESAWGSEL